MKLSFVIPVFRNQGSIRSTYEKVRAVVTETLPGFQYEFVFVDDGSDDGSLAEIESLAEADANVKALSFNRNFGQVPAMTAGFREATGDAAIAMSADMQDPPQLIPRMVNEWLAHRSVVVCHRVDRNDKWYVNVTSGFFYGLIHRMNPKIPKGGFDYVLLGRNELDYFNRIDERNRFFQGDVVSLSNKIVLIPYERLKREVGRSQWTFSKKLKYFIDGVINTSYFPIRLMSLIGLIVSMCGFLFALVIVYNRIIHATPFKGYAPIMITILIVGGMLMLMLGIIGEYLWRIYDEVRKRPNYMIRKRYNC